MFIEQFGSFVYPDLFDNSETGGASRQSNLQALSSGNGSIDLSGSSPSPLVADTIVKSFRIIEENETDFENAKVNLIGEMMLSQEDFRQNERLLIARSGVSRYATRAKCTGATYSQEYFNENSFFVNVQQTFERTIPTWWLYTDLLFLGDNLGTFQDSDDAGYTFGQAVFEQVLTTDTTSFTITNSGNSRMFGGLIEFDGAANNPVITNDKNRHTFTIRRTLVTGDRHTTDILSRNVKFNGVPGFYFDLSIGNKRGQLQPMVLEVGDNDFTITTSGVPNCTFRYYFASAWVR